MKNLLIIGARGWGREIFNMLPCCIGYQTEYEVKGYLDDKKDALDGMDGYPAIISTVEDYGIKPDDVFICALGDAHWKKHYVDVIVSKGGQFINIIHKSSTIGRNTSIGKGCIICENVGISCDIKIGNFVTFQSYAQVGHDATIGNYCHLGVRTFMGGNSSIGDITTLQTSSIVLPHVKIGNNCVAGAGAVVIRKVKDDTTVFGNPAKIIDF